jgi:large subunit ribosomal protein L24
VGKTKLPRVKHKMNIKKGDTVMVVAGKDRSTKTRKNRGQVLEALPFDGKVVVTGMNIAKRHTRPTQKVRQSGIVEKPMPMPVSSVMLICPHCDRPTRVGKRMLDHGAKARVCSKCHQVIDEVGRPAGAE